MLNEADQEKINQLLKEIEKNDGDIKLGVESYNKRISDQIHKKIQIVKAKLEYCDEFENEIDIKAYCIKGDYVYITVLYPYSENEYGYKKCLSADKIFTELLRDIKYSLEAMQTDIDAYICEINEKIKMEEREEV